MKAFFGAAILVLIVSVALVAAGIVGDGGGSASVSSGLTPAVLGEANAPLVAATTPTPAPPATAPLDVPILMYHRVLPELPADQPGGELVVTTAAFSAQMGYLKCAGFTPITVQRLFDVMEGKTWLPENPVVLTFDDGWADQYQNVFPILAQQGFAASFAVISGMVDGEGYMTWAQVKEMSDAGMEITSHSVNHANFASTEDDQTRAEIIDSKATIEAQIGKTVDVLAYPSGEPFRNGSPERQAMVIQTLKDAGYRGALIAQNSYGDQDPARPFELNRMRVTGVEELSTFAGSIYGPPPSEVSCL